MSGELESKSADESKHSGLVVNDMRLTSRHAGHQDAKGTFAGCFIQSEELCGSLIMHSVPLAKNAVKALNASTAALDLSPAISRSISALAASYSPRASVEKA